MFKEKYKDIEYNKILDSYSLIDVLKFIKNDEANKRFYSLFPISFSGIDLLKLDIEANFTLNISKINIPLIQRPSNRLLSSYLKDFHFKDIHRITCIDIRTKNIIYKIFTKTKNYYLKMCHSQGIKDNELCSITFEKEKKCMELLLSKGLPVPHGIYVGYWNSCNFIYMNELEGIPLNSLIIKNTLNENYHLVDSILDFFDKLHSYSFPQNGFLDDAMHIIPKRSSWKEFLKRKILSQFSRDKLRFPVEELLMDINNIDEPKGRFLHNDLTPFTNNLLLKKRSGKWTISGLLDFENSIIGDSLYEQVSFIIGFFGLGVKYLLMEQPLDADKLFKLFDYSYKTFMRKNENNVEKIKVYWKIICSVSPKIRRNMRYNFE